MRFAVATVVLAGLAPFCDFVAGEDSQNKDSPLLRRMRYTHRSKDQAIAWQAEVRGELFKLLKLDDLRGRKIPFDEKPVSSEDKKGYTLREMEIASTAGRRMKIVLTVPQSERPPAGYAAVVCIHGHGGSRHIVYDPKSVYKGFAGALAGSGAVTIATDVGQHQVYEKDRTLMGERLWDVMRCVDYVTAMPQVDRSRIGCAGLSLGGEMAMWLGAMDERVAATVSCGFLTVMDQMEHNHCMCWKFSGLREAVDYADIYSLIAPRALQCQNGLKEPKTDFYVPLARKAMEEIIYGDFGQPGNVELDVHEGGHEVDLPALMRFFKKHLAL
jgi:hypothetical protein